MSMNSDLPATAAVPIVNDAAFAVCRAIYVGVTGDITAIVAGATVEFVNAQAGSILPVRCTMVTAASTATDLVALY
jgi:hypothetical protein